MKQTIVSFFIFSVLFLIGSVGHSKFSIPKNLTAEDRKTLLDILGSGSSSKLLGDPYPLGGYSGMEIGLSTEIISTSEVSRLGAKSSQQSELAIQTLSIGKGLFNRIDAFAQVSLPAQSDEVSFYAGQIRWGFFEADYLPVYASLLLSAGSTNFENAIITNSQGADVVIAFSVDDIALYFGAGTVRTQGRFIGGPDGVTASGETVVETDVSAHYVAGMNIRFQPWFLALQLDRYSQPTYAAKLGVRF